MTNPLTRLLIAIGVVVVSFAGSYAVRAAMETPEVALPDRDFDTLPMQLGKWHGEDVELDPEVFSIFADAKTRQWVFDELLRIVAKNLPQAIYLNANLTIR